MSKEQRATAAVFSPDRLYRYFLSRRISINHGVCTFILLNPSTADEVRNDPTIRRCIGFVREWGYSILVVVNLFAYRTTNPKELRIMRDPIGPENDRFVLNAAQNTNCLVAGWGQYGNYHNRGDDIRYMLRDFGMMCLGKTKQDEPKHPLYLKSTTKLERL